MASQRVIECACCGQSGRLGGRGLIVNCESRIRKYHRDDLADFPRRLRARADMLDDYATWRARRPEATQQEIAAEMGVTRSALRRALDRDRARARDETTAPRGQEETPPMFDKVCKAIGGGVAAFDGLIERVEQRLGYESPDRERLRWDAAYEENLDSRLRAGLNPHTAQAGAAEAADEATMTAADRAERRAAQYAWEAAEAEYGPLNDAGAGEADQARDVELSEAEQADLTLSEDIAAGAVPVEYTDDGVWIADGFHSHDSIPDAAAAQEPAARADGPAFDEPFLSWQAKQVAAEYRDAGNEEAAASWEQRGEDYQRLFTGDSSRSEDRDQWRAPGTAGHDEEWSYWEHEDRSDDQSDALGR